MLVQIKSRVSGNMNVMEINTTPEKLQQWQRFSYEERPYIQDFFPELSADEREFLLSGTTPTEWRELFRDE